MLVLCYGMPETGSTLAFEMVRAVLQFSGCEQDFIHNDQPDLTEAERTSRNYVQTITKEKISELIAAIGPQRKIAVQTHAALRDDIFVWLEELQGNREIQIVTSFRDPRDACLSLLDESQKARKGIVDSLHTLDEAVPFVQARNARFRKWSAINGSLRLLYDTVFYEPERAIAAIESALDIASDRKRVLQQVFGEGERPKLAERRPRYLQDMDNDQIDRLGVKFRRFILKACERDSQSWYDECRMNVLKGDDEQAEL